MTNTFYTSDSHWFHKNIMQYEQRPYEAVEEMNEDLIEKWNSTVNANDIVYHLGDFVFGSKAKWEQILDRLNGKIHLIRGNHDDEKVLKKVSHLFESVEDMVVKKIDKNHLYFFHYPIEIGLTPRTFSIHGHIHGQPSSMINQINVGIDSTFTKEAVGFGKLVPEDILIAQFKSRNEQIIRMRGERKT